MKPITLALITVPFLLHAGSLSISVHGIKSTKGNIVIGLYNQSKGFLKTSKRYRGVHLRARGRTSRYTFTSIPAGTYAIGVFHDANHNGQLDRNFLGIPKEGYGVSNNPRVFGKPAFSQCSFHLKKNKKISIQMRY
jgi:uncharacterized protein (DUF2141 family)